MIKKEQKIAAREPESDLSSTDGPHAFPPVGQWVREEWRGGQWRREEERLWPRAAIQGRAWARRAAALERETRTSKAKWAVCRG